MKTTNIRILKIIAIAMISGLIALFGCKKEIPVNINDNPANAHRYSNLSDEEIEQMIVDFLDLLENPEGKDPVEIDEAIWFLDASLNYKYSIANRRFSGIYRDSAFIDVYFPSSQISASTLSLLFCQIIDTLSEKYTNVDVDDKHLIDVSIELGPLDDGNGILKIMSFIGTNGEYEFPDSYGSNDYWHWAWGLGRCGGYSGGSGLDAAKLFTLNTNFSIGYIQESEVIRAICINKETIEKFALDYPTNNNPYGSYLLFEASGTGSPPPANCLSPDEMNYYQTLIPNIMYNNLPNGKGIILYDVQPDILTSTQYWGRYHRLFMHFGKYIYVSGASVSPL
jgi:hypothetical protein